jgi:hypothetical protein
MFQPVAEKDSSTKVDGSGMVALASAASCPFDSLTSSLQPSGNIRSLSEGQTKRHSHRYLTFCPLSTNSGVLGTLTRAGHPMIRTISPLVQLLAMIASSILV